MNRPSPTGPSDPFTGLQLLTEDAYQSLGSMEAAGWEAAAPPAGSRARELAPGLTLAALVTAGAMALHSHFSSAIPIGAAVVAMLIGMLIRNTLPVQNAVAAGCQWIVARLIPVAIVLIGAGLDLGILVAEGWRFLGYLIAAVVISTFAAILLAPRFGVAHRTALLIGAGTGICGSSAILAIAPVIKAERNEILLSVGAINLIGLVAMFACIGLAGFLPMEATEFGILTGATIHAVPTVAAAALDHSEIAGEVATLVKMGRVTMLIPFAFLVAAFRVKKATPESDDRKSNPATRVWQSVPWFVWGFAATAVLNSLGLIPVLEFPQGALLPDGLHFSAAAFHQAGKLLLTLAMAAIGLQVGLRSMLRAGGRTVALAAAVWVLLASIVGSALLLF